MISAPEALTLMKPEIKCQDCFENKRYTVSDVFNFPEVCPTCSGKGIIVEDVIMMIIGNLIRAWECKESGFVETDNPDFRFTGLNSMEDHLTKALLLLLVLSEVLDIELSKDQIANYKHSNMKILHLLTFPMVIWQLVRDNPIGLNSVLKVKMSWFYSDLLQFCKQNSIDIDQHIKAYQEKS